MIATNGLAGAFALVAHWWTAARRRWIWWCTIAAESFLVLQVLVGVVLLANDYEAEDLHVFYGFVAFLAVGLAYSYRPQMRGRLELLYGLVGLFLMGVGLRAALG